MPPSEPSSSITDPCELLLSHLAYHRATVLAKLDGLSDEDLRTSRLPSGWSPLELLKHLVYVERRWMQYGFEGQAVPQPWGDDDPVTKRWRVTEDDDVAALAAWWDKIAARTATVVRATDLTQRGRLGGRFTSEAPTLGMDPGAPRAGERPARRPARRRARADRRTDRRVEQRAALWQHKNVTPVASALSRSRLAEPSRRNLE